jgi:hypothetical protein
MGAGTHPAVKNKRRSLTREPKAIRELHVQLHEMRNAAKPFLTDEARKVYWAQAWVTIPASDPSSSVTSTTVRPAEAGTRRAIRQPATAP